MLALIIMMGVIAGSVLHDVFLSSYVKNRKILYCLMNSAVYLLLFCFKGWNVETLIYSLMASILLIISIIDYHFYEIPVKFNYYLLVLGIVHSFMDYKNILDYFAGSLCVSFFLCIILLVSDGRMMGGGDVKLMASCGMILGIDKSLFSFYLGCVLALVVHFLQMLLKKKGKTVAMGPYLSAGILIVVLMN